MRRDQPHGLRVIAMRQRNASVRRAGQCRRDTRNHFVIYAARAQKLEFFPAATEDERIAALQTHDTFAGLRMLEHQRVNPRLCRVVIFAGRLAHFESLGVASREVDNLGADQPIVQDHIGLVQHAQRAQCEQTRITRTGPDQRNRTVWNAFVTQHII